MDDLKQRVLEELRYSGAGNRFLLVDNRRSNASPKQLGACIRGMAGHEFNPDGLLILEGAEHYDARLTIVNRDGSRAAACGNGLRCVGLHLALLVHTQGRDQTAFRVLTDSGPRRVECDLPALDPATECEASPRAEIGAGRVLEPAMRVLVGNRTIVGSHVEVGNTHLVLFVDDLDNAPVEELGSALTTYAGFSEGANVGFAERQGPSSLRLRVYERGVGETLACGTGAAAAALAAGDPLPIDVSLRGGSLRVERDDEGIVWIVGPARRHAG